MISLIFAALQKNTALVKLLGAAALVVALIAAYQLWHHKVDKQGYERANAEWLAKTQAADLKAATALQSANKSVFDKQLQIANLQDQINQRYQESQDAQNKYTALRAAYANNTKRLQLAGATCASDRAEQDQSASAASGSAQAGQCTVLPAVAATIFDIARRNRDDVQNLNRCIDLYNAVLEAVND